MYQIDLNDRFEKSLVGVGSGTFCVHCFPRNATSMHTTSGALIFSHVTPFSVLKDLKYADTHEWVKVEGDSATVGITDHAQVDTFTYFYHCEFGV